MLSHRDVPGSAEPPTDLEAQIRKALAAQSLKLTQWLVGASCLANLLWWGADFVLYGDQPQVLEHFSRFRALILGTALLYLATSSRTPFRRFHVAWGTLLGSLTAAGIAAALGGLGGLREPWFASLYFAPMMTMAFLVGPWVRVGLTACVAVATGAGFFGVYPEHLSAPGLSTAAGLMLFSSGIFVLAGHLVFWMTRAATRRRLELEAMTDVLSHGFSERTRELGQLAAQLETLRESERAAVARDLHDEFGQVLTGMRLELDMAHRVHQHGGDLSPQHERLGALLDETFSTTRRLMEHLRPRILEEQGLAAALEWLAQDTRDRTGLTLALKLPEALAMTPAVETTIFRVVQEGLTNIQRHAQAQAARITIGNENGELRVRIEDDGCGMPLAEDRRDGAVGLLGMGERAQAVGGHLTLGTSTLGGALLTLCVPLSGMEST